jgi:hypothetical protein
MPMDDFTTRIFLFEIKQQCARGLASYAAMTQAISARTSSEVFAHVQAFMTASGLVSKILFPGQVHGDAAFKQACQQRGEALCSLLTIDAASPLADRTLRDSLEHMDERMQEWAERPGPKNFIDGGIMVGTSVQQAIRIAGGSQLDIFRILTTPPPTVEFWGLQFPLQPIAQALDDMAQKVAPMVP